MSIIDTFPRNWVVDVQVTGPTHRNADGYLNTTGDPVTIADRSAPLDIMRQVQIGAGSLVLLGVIGGAFLSPALYWLAAFVGAGLLTAGLTGFCGMSKILARMPWNRV